MAPDPGALPQTPPHFAPPPWRGGGVAENGRKEWNALNRPVSVPASSAPSWA